MNASTVFKNYLLGHLLDHCRMSPKGVQAIGAKYDALVKQAEPEQAFKQLLDSYGSCDAEQTTASILTELEKLNREHAGVNTDGISRLKKYCARYNSNLAKLEIEIIDDKGTVKTLSQTERDKLKLNPRFLPAGGFTHTAIGSFRGKPVQFDIEVKF